MTNTLSTINDSISELLSSLDENSDREILLPVIESLLQELKFNENANMISFRQLVADITSFILDSDQLENKNKKQFQWLKELTLAGHDIIMKSLRSTNLLLQTMSRAILISKK